MDETICPEDYERGGMITDDQLFDRLVAPLPSGDAHTHTLLPARHSKNRQACAFSLCWTVVTTSFTVVRPQRCFTHPLSMIGCVL